MPNDSTPTTKQPNNQLKTSQKVPLIVGIILGIILVFFAGVTIENQFSRTNKSSTAVTEIDGNSDGNTIVTPAEKDISNVAAKVSPSIVSIITQSQVESYYNRPQLATGAGTGMVISTDGYILTNKHVVSGAGTVDIVASDGTRYKGVKVIGEDPLNDIAILKVSGVTDLKPVELGNSSTVRVGESVIAIGNSLGQYQNTVTSGIISGTGRPVTAQAEGGTGIENLTDLLQTDAAINPGNSGGPLLNFQGQVIGMNTAIAENAQGIGFAIPINATKGIIKGVLEKGVVEHGYLGVNYIPITPDVASFYKLDVDAGAYVFNSKEGNTAVASGSPADKAGIEDKDIILKVNGTEIGAKGDLSSLIAQYQPGDNLTLEIERDGKTSTIDVTLGTYRR